MSDAACPRCGLPKNRHTYVSPTTCVVAGPPLPEAGDEVTAAQGRDMEAELRLQRVLIIARQALHEIADNTERLSYQHRSRALLALDEMASHQEDQ